MKKVALLTILVLAFWGCSTFSRSYKLGTEAAVNKNWDKAIKYYERAVLEDPENSVYRLALLRAKISASYMHLLEARKLASQGRKEEALVEYEKALSYDPLNRYIAEEAKGFKEEEVVEEEPKKIGIELPVKLRVNKEKITLKFAVQAPLRSIFKALGKHARINILFDEQFKDIPFAVDLVDMTFEQALDSLCLASKNFYRIIDERTVIIAPDQPQKRIQYELNAIKTFYLSNIKAQDIQTALQQMLRTQFKAPNIFVDKNLNSVTVKDTPAVVELAERILAIWDKPKGEVIIDLEIMEVSRMKLRQFGLDLEQSLIGLRYIGPPDVTSESGWFRLRSDELDFSKAEHFQISLPSSIVRFLESDADTKIISQPRLRGIQDEEIKYMVGDQIPIPRTTFTPIAAGGISQQPITSFEYKDVGIDVKITPKIHFEREITLELEIKIKSLGGTGYANIPIITTREVKNVIRLKDGETNLLAGLLKDEERKTLRGIAGIKNIPLLGSLFSSTDQTIQQTDVILTITPYIIRMVPITEEDLKPLWVGQKGITPSARPAPRLPEQELYEQRMRQRAEREEMARRGEGTGPNEISLNPGNFVVPQNREFRIGVNIRTQEEIANMSLTINFNAQVLRLKQVIEGAFIRQLGERPSLLKNIDNSSGLCNIGFSGAELDKGIKGAGSLVALVFESVSKGESAISITNVSANSPSGQAVTFQTKDSRLVVR